MCFDRISLTFGCSIRIDWISRHSVSTVNSPHILWVARRQNKTKFVSISFHRKYSNCKSFNINFCIKRNLYILISFFLLLSLLLLLCFFIQKICFPSILVIWAVAFLWLCVCVFFCYRTGKVFSWWKWKEYKKWKNEYKTLW